MRRLWHLPTTLQRFRVSLAVAVFFSFCLLGCVSTSGMVERGKIWRGMSKTELENSFMLANQFQHPLSITARRKYFSDQKVEVIAPRTNEIAFVFENVSIPSDPPIAGLDLNPGNGTRVAWFSHFEEAVSSVSKPIRQTDSIRSIVATPDDYLLYKSVNQQAEIGTPLAINQGVFLCPNSLRAAVSLSSSASASNQELIGLSNSELMQRLASYRNWSERAFDASFSEFGLDYFEMLNVEFQVLSGRLGLEAGQDFVDQFS
jgi:hypothetical protein